MHSPKSRFWIMFCGLVSFRLSSHPVQKQEIIASSRILRVCVARRHVAFFLFILQQNYRGLSRIRRAVGHETICYAQMREVHRTSRAAGAFQELVCFRNSRPQYRRERDPVINDHERRQFLFPCFQFPGFFFAKSLVSFFTVLHQMIARFRQQKSVRSRSSRTNKGPWGGGEIRSRKADPLPLEKVYKLLGSSGVAYAAQVEK